MTVRDPILFRIIAHWDWKIHMIFFLMGFLSGLIPFLLTISGQGSNPLGNLSRPLILSIVDGLYFLFFDFAAFFLLARMAWKKDDKRVNERLEIL